MPVLQPRLANIFRDLGASIGADVMPDEHGVVTLHVGDDVELSVEVPDESAFVYFHSPVRRLVAGSRAAEIEGLMRQNLFRLPVSGAWLALDAEADEILLCYAAPAQDLTADKLASIIEALSEAVREVRSEQGAGDGADEDHSLNVDTHSIRV
jgi:hypothetical protein